MLRVSIKESDKHVLNHASLFSNPNFDYFNENCQHLAGLSVTVSYYKEGPKIELLTSHLI